MPKPTRTTGSGGTTDSGDTGRGTGIGRGGRGGFGNVSGAASCMYEGKEYSDGATVEMPGSGGTKIIKRCNNGSWVAV